MTQTDTNKNKAKIGNTNDFRARTWCFTLNNPTIFDEEHLTHTFNEKSTAYIFQLEEGNNKTPHFQGFVDFKNPCRLSTLKHINDRIHWEVCRKNDKSILYCQKKEGRLSKPIYKNVPIIEEKNNIIKEFYDWELDILNIINEKPDDRCIWWYYDEKGGKGKTTFCKYLVKEHNALYLSGKSSDNKYCIYKYITKQKKTFKIAIFDFTRSMETYISYQSLEEIKNGIFMNTKYECEMVTFDTPHVIVFANFLPDMSKLSEDRWKIITL